MNIVHAIPVWFAQTPELRSKHTKETYRSQLMQFDSSTGRKPIERVTVNDMVNYCTQGSPSPNTVQVRRKALLKFFGWAHLSGLYPTDPSVELKRRIRVGSKTIRKNHWLTRTQLSELLEGAEDPRDRLILYLAAYTGLRVSEISNLTWADVDLEGGRLAVKGKGEKHAYVGIAAPLHRVLSEAARSRSNGPVVLGQRWGAKGEQLGARGIRERVHVNGARIGVPELRPHDLRRSLAGILHGDGVPLEDVQAVLRHTNIGTTMRYLEDNPMRGVERMKGFVL